jgi:ABC-2 type transport system permease protein
VRTALLIAGNDLRQRLRDRSAILVAIVAPLVLAVVLSITIPDFSSGGVNVELGLVDLDRGQAAQQFREAIVDSPRASGFATFRSAATLAQGRRLAQSGDVSATIVLPRGLSAAVLGQRRARIDVLGNVDRPIGTLVARSLSESFASVANTIDVASAAAGATGLARARIAAGVASATPPVAIVDISSDRHQLDPKTYFAAAMSVFFLFFTVQFGISSLLDERRDGTLARMLAAPIRRSSVLLGKVLTSLALGCASMGVLALATHYLLGAHWGNPIGVAILIASAVVAATGVTALVVTLAKTDDQANAWLSIVAVVLGMLGGSFFPVAQAGGLLEMLSRITPHAWFLSGLQDLAAGGEIGIVVKPALVLLAIALASGSLALVRIRRLIEP